MIQLIDVRLLCKGMYVKDVSIRSKRENLYSIEGFVLHNREGQTLYEQGYRICYIDTELGSSVAPEDCLTDDIAPLETATLNSSTPVPAAPTRDFREELPQAQKLHDSGIALARKFFQNKGIEVLPVTEVKRFADDIQASLRRNSNALISLSKLRQKDDYTFSHSLNVSLFAMLLGTQLGLESDFLNELACAGFLHDMGKMFVARQALNFPGTLSPSQMKEVRSHVLRGYDYLKSQSGISDIVLEGELDHQERYDGSGYPHNKRGDEISLAGRILAVADVYDALSSERCYKPAMLPSKALSLMYQTRESSFAPGYMEAFIQAMGVYPPGSWVRLSDHTLALIMEVNPQERLRPRVSVLADNKGKPCPPRAISLQDNDGLTILGPVQHIPPACLNQAETLLRLTR